MRLATTAEFFPEDDLAGLWTLRGDRWRSFGQADRWRRRRPDEPLAFFFTVLLDRSSIDP
jgi:hypothetical protein